MRFGSVIGGHRSRPLRHKSTVALVAIPLALTTLVATGCASTSSSSNISSSSNTSNRGGSSPSATTGSPYLPGGAAIRPAVTPIGRKIDQSISVNGTMRTYHLYVPKSLPTGGVPLLVALHGGLGSGAQFEQNTDFDGLAEANGFLVVYPDGTSTNLGPDHLVWNAGGCCGAAEASRDNVDDVAFIRTLIVHLESTYDVDRARVFVTGHSNGALLAYVLACQLSQTVDAIAVQAGALLESGCHPTDPVAAMEIHGTDDQNIPINGGKGSSELSGTTFPPPVDALETIASADGCSPASTSPDPSNEAVTIESWTPCAASTTVQWVKVSGANHAWMGHPPSSPAAESLVGAPFMGFDSSAAVWSYLAAHPRA